MSLRDELIEAGAEVIVKHNLGPTDDRWISAKVLDAMLDKLTERAAEWERQVDAFGAKVQVYGEVSRSLLAVLRNPGSSE